MNTFELQIKDILIADRKCAREKLEQLKNQENYGLTICESDQYYRDWLDKIDETMNRLENGDFNICRLCSGPIGEARLRAMPYAELCINCQKKQTVRRLIYAFSPR